MWGNRSFKNENGAEILESKSTIIREMKDFDS